VLPFVLAVHDIFIPVRLLSSLLLAAIAFAQPQPQPPLARLQSNIERITKSVNADWGIYVKCLETGEEIAINADKQMDTMSVIKIPLMVEAFRQIEAGKFSLEDKITLKDSDKRPGTGVIRSLDPGAVLTIKDLLTLMIIVSDNTATDLLFEKVGGIEPVNQLAQSFGLKNTRAVANGDAWFKALRAAKSSAEFHSEGKHPFGLSSPRDIGVILEKMERGQAVSKKSSDLMLQMMRGQLYSSRLPKYVSGFRIPHKTGDFPPFICNDVGIFESPSRNIVVSVFTAHHYGATPALEDAIGRVGEQIADYFTYR
jgi:beta-lactamase class A